jgi:hypothetical protein
MREILMAHKDIIRQLENIETKLLEHDDKIRLLYDYIKQLEQVKQEDLENKSRRKIGYKQNNSK